MSQTTAETAVAPSNLVELLHRRGTAQSDELAYTWLDARGEESARICWGELRTRSLALAARLQASGCVGHGVLLLLPPSLDFISGFFACLSAGAVAVPAYPPASKRHLPRLRAIVRDARPRCLLVPAQQISRLRSSLADWPELEGVRWIAVDEVEPGEAGGWQDPGRGENDLAFLQYTSGSTAAPKGVMITHGNLMANQEVIRRGFGTSPESVVVGWLPLFHDMGLIGNVLQPLYLGARCVSMAPVDFLRRPSLWLEAISRYRATTSGGPDFAYALCVQRIAEEERRGLDLSCWSTAFSGAEPVRAQTLDLFARTFRAHGFDPRAFLPCYGLAESTLMVSGAETGRPVRTLLADAGALEQGEIRPGTGPSARRLVSCGRPGAQHRVCIVEPESQTLTGADRVGEIWVEGPSVARGYWNRPEATAGTFRATLATTDEGSPSSFLRTGDLGFLHDDELYITGRLKDLIIVRGRNLYPQDLELTAEQCDPALLPASGAAFSVERDGGELLVLVHEVHRHAEDLPRIAQRIRQAIAEAHEVVVHEVVLIRPASLPKTSSGKVQRSACRAEYTAGELRVLTRSTASAEPGSPTALQEVVRPSLEGLAPEARRQALTELVRDLLLATGRFRASDLDLESPLTSSGLDSLGAVELSTALENHLGVGLPIADLLSGATPRELATKLDEASSQAPRAAGPSSAETAIDSSLTQPPSSWGQRALWHLQRMDPESPVYIVAGAGRLRGPLDSAALERAFEELCRRHDTLRTTFETLDGELQTRIHGHLGGGFLEVRLETFHPGCLEELAQEPFDLEEGPPIRLAVVETGRHTYLVLALHHLVGDFRSLEVLLAHLGRLYAAEAGAAPVDGSIALGASPTAYGDWARRQQERMAGPEGRHLLELWRQRLDGFPVALDLPLDRPRPQTESFAGGSLAWRSGREAGRRLSDLARRLGATSQMAALAALQVLLMRISGRRRVLVGSPTTLRDDVGLAETVGYFVNPVILRGDATPDPGSSSLSFTAFLERVRSDALAAYDLRALPFPLLVESLQPEVESGRSPYFQVMLTWQRDRGAGNELASFLLAGEGARFDLGGLELEAVELQGATSPFELTLSLAETDGDLAGRWTYRTDLFDATTVERLGGQLRTLLQNIVHDPSTPLDQLPLLTPAQRHQMLHEWNEEPSYPLGGFVHLRIAERGVVQPDAVAAVTDDGTHWTYGRLLAETAVLAAELRRRGVGPETLVPVLLQRSIDMVLGLLAVVSAGGAYLPLDPEQPPERLAAVLDDARHGARLPLLLTQTTFGESPAGWTGPVLALEVSDREAGTCSEKASESLRALSATLRPEHPIYVIHTSGSTGRPKGVVIPHGAVSNRIRWVEAREPEAARAMLQKISLTFDISVVEVFAPLASGGRLVITRPGGQREPEYLLTRAAEERVAQLSFSPSQLQSILEQRGLDSCPGLRSVVTGGETVPPELPGRVLDQAAVEVTNRYGPTETTISVALWSCGRHEGSALPIGRPIGQAKIFLLDRRLDPVPPGSAGELAIAGPGLARGYLGRPAETAQRFVPHPLAEVPGERIYRSGDLARHRADGALMFLGRIDQQVKVRGFRIELGDVETALSKHPEVRETAVVDFPGGEGGSRRLAAFVVPQSGERPEPGELRQFLGERLPGYMVPAAFVGLDALPLTTSGKVDRKALPVPDWTAAGSGVSTALSSPTEELVAEVWAAVLGETDRRIGAEDNFFDLGGHSLLATRAVSRLRQTLGVDLPLRELFESPTVAGLARRIDAVRRTQEGIEIPPLRRAARESTAPLSFAQERLWFLDRLEPASVAYNIPAAVRLTGSLRADRLAAALGGIVARHEALRTVFQDSEGKPEQVVGPASAEWALPLVDLSRLPAEGPGSRKSLASELAREEAERFFDLEAGPMVRATLLRLDAEEHHLLLTFHHIVADGWSLGVFVDELAAFLQHLSSDSGRQDLAPLPLQYRDFAVWQRSWLTEEVMAGQLEWWKGRLEQIPPLELPLDRPRGPLPGGRGRRVPLLLGAALTTGVRRLARDRSATAFMVLLSALGVVLTRTSGQRRWSVGTPIANRSQRELEGLIGFFVNTLVVPADLDQLPSPTFAALLEQMREHTLGAYAHQDLPFEKLVEALQPDRASSHTPLFQVMLVYHNEPVAPPRVPGLEMELLPAETEGTTKFDLTVTFLDHGETLEGYFEYDRDLFDDTRMRRMAGHFERLLRGGIETPEEDLFTLPMLARSERFQLLAEWNDTGRPLDPLPADMLERFRHQVALQPDAVALEWVHGEPGAASYGELLRRIDSLSHDLLARGIAAEGRVGLLVERSPAFVVAMLGALGAGAAFLPLDPEYPRERLESMLADGEPRIVLVAGDAAVALGTELQSIEGPGGGFELVELDFGGRVLEPRRGSTMLLPAIDHARTAYVIYTSGSTGRPKGIVMSHGPLVNLVRWQMDRSTVGVGSRTLQLASPNFDVSYQEVLSSLGTGGTLVLIAEPLRRDVVALVGLLRAARIERLFLPFVALEQLAVVATSRGLVPEALREVVTAGEQLRTTEALADLFRCLPGASLENQYGPSEAHVITAETLRGDPAPWPRLPAVGRVIDETRIYLLDRGLRPVPPGVPGELAVGGLCLARGYLGRAALTAENFVPDPFSAGGRRLYRTGDLARQLSDGRYEFLGRIDHQIKIRGYRVELAEIEVALVAHPEIRQAVVSAQGTGGNRRLVAHVETSAALDVASLRGFLGETLPNYMVPASFVFLERLPLMNNGKVDRRALPEPEIETEETSSGQMATPYEELVAAAFAEVLDQPRIERDDDFFALGGHSLLATQVVSRLRASLGVEVPLQELFDASTVRELAARLESGLGGSVARLPAIEPLEEGEEPPLSFAQERMWFIDRLTPGHPAYHIAATVLLSGELDVPAFHAALAGVEARQSGLRCCFEDGDTGPVLRVSPPSAPALPRIDLEGLEGDAASRELDRLARAEALRPFDLERGPLLRATLVRLSSQGHALFLTLHHIVADGWSMGVLVRELGELYRAARDGRRAGLPELPVSYAAFAAWQRKWLRGDHLEEILGWWRDHLQGAPERLELPTDRPRPRIQTWRSGIFRLPLGRELSNRLRSFSRQRGVTLFMTLLAGFQAVLARHSGQRDVVVGSPIANRTRGELEGLIGLFVNTLVLRQDLSGDPSFREHLDRVRETTLAAYAHQDCPFEKLVEALRPRRDLGYTPLFQVMLVLQNAPLEVRLPGLRLEPLPVTSGAAKFDLTVSVTEGFDDPELGAAFEYNRDLFDSTTVTRLAGHWRRLLASVVEEPEQPLSHLTLLSAAEQAQLTGEWNSSPAPGPAIANLPRNLFELFAIRAEERPDGVALSGELGWQMTYGELHRRALGLAARLRREGIAPGEFVGLFLERSPAQVVAMLGTLAAGAAYVPIDPAYPSERVAWIAEDSGFRLLLTDPGARNPLPREIEGLRTVSWDLLSPGDRKAGAEAERMPELHPEAVAYVIYTSGSTGKPKGSPITHQNVASLLAATQRQFGFDPEQVFTLFHSYAFDFSIWEVWGALAWGGRVAVVSYGVSRSPEELRQLLGRERVTVLSQTPSAFLQLVPAMTRGAQEDRATGSSLRHVVFGGEALEPARLAPWFEVFGDGSKGGAGLVNMYGITETTVHVTYRLLTEADVSEPGRSPVGRPLDHLQTYLLDPYGNRVPAGVVGEIHVGGEGLGHGYLHRPSLTATRFVPSPFGPPGARLYRSGDLARFLTTGELDFLGRLDHQVKIRGFRIELGEIESALASDPAVTDVAVLAMGAAAEEVRLVAYLVIDGENEGVEARLRAHLGEHLPGYMCPAAYVVLDQLPMTAHGKLDRRALPDPGGARPEIETVYREPETALEIVLCEVWAEALDVEQVGLDDNFFELGGHSLLATRIIAWVRETLEVEIPLTHLFEAPTVAGLGAALVANPESAPRVRRTAELLLEMADDSLEEE